MLLQSNNIKKLFKQADITIEVLKGVTAAFESGKSYAITGPSGSGKSTLIHVLAGLDAPDEGTVFFDEHNLAVMSTNQREQFLNESIGLVFQLPYLIPELSVIDNVKLKGMIKGMSPDECQDQAMHLLTTVGLAHKANHNPLSLSGGEQQRVAIARALFNKPAFLLADEPTGNLDVDTGKKIVDLMLQCQEEWGMGIIVSSHDAYVAQKMKTVLRLNNGKLEL